MCKINYNLSNKTPFKNIFSEERERKGKEGKESEVK